MAAIPIPVHHPVVPSNPSGDISHGDDIHGAQPEGTRHTPPRDCDNSQCCERDSGSAAASSGTSDCDGAIDVVAEGAQAPKEKASLRSAAIVLLLVAVTGVAVLGCSVVRWVASMTESARQNVAASRNPINISESRFSEFTVNIPVINETRGKEKTSVLHECLMILRGEDRIWLERCNRPEGILLRSIWSQDQSFVRTPSRIFRLLREIFYRPVDGYVAHGRFDQASGSLSDIYKRHNEYISLLNVAHDQGVQVWVQNGGHRNDPSPLGIDGGFGAASCGIGRISRGIGASSGKNSLPNQDANTQKTAHNSDDCGPKIGSVKAIILWVVLGSVFSGMCGAFFVAAPHYAANGQDSFAVAYVVLGGVLYVVALSLGGVVLK